MSCRTLANEAGIIYLCFVKMLGEQSVYTPQFDSEIFASRGRWCRDASSKPVYLHRFACDHLRGTYCFSTQSQQVLQLLSLAQRALPDVPTVTALLNIIIRSFAGIVTQSGLTACL
jgi:hypothetical protein